VFLACVCSLHIIKQAVTPLLDAAANRVAAVFVRD
jgi:hypothetical protein